jgi:lactoylglutathione lyase
MNKMKIAGAAFVLLSCVAASQSGTTAKSPEFDHTTVYVHNLQKSADFYEKVIGLEKIPEPFHDGRHVWFRVGPHEQLHVVSGAIASADHDINVHLAFRLSSVPDFSARLDHLGIPYRKSVRGDGKVASIRPDGVQQIYFQDPDGYWIEINDDKF